jgi:hypothetical protein
MFFRRLAVAGVCLLGGMRAHAQLAANSPFLPPTNTAVAAPTQNGPIEYRGFIETPAGALYRISDQQKKGYWIKLNEKSPDTGVLAKKYDADRRTLVIEHEGRTVTLEERVSKIVSSGPAAQVMAQQPMPMPNAGMSPAVTQTVVANPSPAEEQKRLEAVAAEVARRRALREQASTQLNQGVTPVITVPQVQPAQQRPQQAGQNNVQNNQQGNGRRGGQGGRQQK